MLFSLQVPTFQIAVESTVVVTITPYTPGGFQDMLATVSDGAATICLLGQAQIPYPTFINSVEVLEVSGAGSLAAATLKHQTWL